MAKHKGIDQNSLIKAGMELVYKRLVDFKRKVNSDLVVWKDNQIVRLKP